ncbi:hypothetical protein, partial [Thiolapillus sp.]|uniref:hypothetical protein n=3 Tax=Thiolapillus sp. TaxID=2017437 RepID=UPI003AF97F76
MLLRTWLPYDWTPRSEAYFVFPLAQGTPGKQCGLAATGDYQPSLRSPWLAASDRNNVSLPARTILEMAICECPTAGGHQLSRWKLGELLAKAALLVEVAMDSDAVNSDLIEPRIGLHLNGEYDIDRGFHNTVIEPFLTAYFREGFEGAAGRYTKLYRDE